MFHVPLVLEEKINVWISVVFDYELLRLLIFNRAQWNGSSMKSDKGVTCKINSLSNPVPLCVEVRSIQLPEQILGLTKWQLIVLATTPLVQGGHFVPS